MDPHWNLPSELDATQLLADTMSPPDGQDSPTNDNEDCDEELIEDVLPRLTKLLDSAKATDKIDRLHAAVSLLQDALDKETYGEERSTMIRYCLIKALLTRYRLYQWVEDLDACFPHLKGVEDINDFFNHLPEDSHGGIAEVKEVLQLIGECQKIDVDIVNAVVSDVQEAIGFTMDDDDTLLKAKLHILFGNALAIRHCYHWGTGDLDSANYQFEDALELSAGDASLLSLSFTSLTFAQWLLFPLGDDDALARIREYTSEASTVDEQGRTLFDIGMRIVERASEGPVNDAEVHEAVTALSTSLQHRTAPHPRRWSSLHYLARALLIRFELKGDQKDLEDCILLHEESLKLRPVPHPDHVVSVNRLSTAISSK